MTHMMERVVDPDGRRRARRPGAGLPRRRQDRHRPAGRARRAAATTAPFTVSFAGFAPADNPRFTVYVVVQNPRNGGGGGSVGGPAFAKIMGYALRRYGVPADRAPSPRSSRSSGEAGPARTTGSLGRVVSDDLLGGDPSATTRAHADLDDLADVAAATPTASLVTRGDRGRRERHRAVAELRSGSCPATCTPPCRAPAPTASTSCAAAPSRPARSRSSPTPPVPSAPAPPACRCWSSTGPRAVLGRLAARVYGDPADATADDRRDRHPGQDHDHPARRGRAAAGRRAGRRDRHRRHPHRRRGRQDRPDHARGARTCTGSSR